MSSGKPIDLVFQANVTEALDNIGRLGLGLQRVEKALAKVSDEGRKTQKATQDAAKSGEQGFSAATSEVLAYVGGITAAGAALQALARDQERVNKLAIEGGAKVAAAASATGDTGSVQAIDAMLSRLSAAGAGDREKTLTPAFKAARLASKDVPIAEFLRRFEADTMAADAAGVDDADKDSFNAIAGLMRKTGPAGGTTDAGAQGRAKLLMESGVGEEGKQFIEEYVASGGSRDEALAILMQGKRAGLEAGTFRKILNASTAAATAPGKTTTLADGRKVKSRGTNANPLDVFRGALGGGALPSGVDLSESLGPKLKSFAAQGNLAAATSGIGALAEGVMRQRTADLAGFKPFQASEAIEALQGEVTEAERRRANMEAEWRYQDNLASLRFAPGGAAIADFELPLVGGKPAEMVARAMANVPNMTQGGAGQSPTTFGGPAAFAPKSRVVAPQGARITVNIDNGGTYDSSNGN